MKCHKIIIDLIKAINDTVAVMVYDYSKIYQSNLDIRLHYQSHTPDKSKTSESIVVFAVTRLHEIYHEII